MMHYLNKNLFKPAVIFFSMLILPSIIALIIAYAVVLEIALLIIMLSFSLVYIAIIITMLCISKNKKWFILIEDEYVQIQYLDNFQGETNIKINYEEIKQIEYCRITSIKGWFVSLGAYVFPQSVCITFVEEDVEKRRHIGYLSKEAIKELENKNVKIKMY